MATRARKFASAAIVVIALLVLGCAGIWLLGKGVEEEASQSQPTIKLEEPPSQEEVESMDIQPLDGDFIVPSVGMSTGLESMSEVNGSINPPGLQNGYMLRDHGTPDSPEDGTVYVAIHSVQGADLPGNKLINVEDATSAIGEGDTIEVSGHEYAVNNSYVVDKDKIGERQELWEEEPGKLVVLTCLQRPEGRSLQNVVIEAHSN